MWKEDLYYCKETINPNSVITLTMAGITYCDGTYRIIRENSPFYLFEYIIEGEGVVMLGSQSYTPKRGDVYILHSGSDYEYYSSSNNPWTKIWFTVTGNLVNHLIQTYGLFNVHHLENIDVQHFFEKLINMLKYNCYSIEEIALLFHKLLICFASSINTADKHYSPIALAIKSYLDSHIEERVTLEYISKQFYKCPSQIIRIFKKDFDITPYEYLLNFRIETAKHLLHNTCFSVKEIALKLQFTDEHYFSNFFKSKVGMSPSQYRQTSPVRYV